MSVALYGIAGCDSVKRSRTWLATRGVDYRFHDFKRDGVPADRLDTWMSAVGWQALLNRKGTTWRKLEQSVRDRVVDMPSARELMLAHSSVIKRPVAEWGDGTVTVGFDASDWAKRRSGL